MTIEYILNTALLEKQGARVFTVKADGEVILECLTEAELNALTVGEIRKLAGEVRA